MQKRSTLSLQPTSNSVEQASCNFKTWWRWRELCFWSTKPDDSGWWRTVTKEGVSNAQRGKKIVPWTSVSMILTQTRAASGGVWGGLFRCYCASYERFENLAPGQRYQRHVKLNYSIPRQNCQTGNWLQHLLLKRQFEYFNYFRNLPIKDQGSGVLGGLSIDCIVNCRKQESTLTTYRSIDGGSVVLSPVR